MKTTAVLASALACAGSAIAAPTESYYNLVATATGKDIDGASLKANGGWFFIGKETASTCGDVSPALTATSGGVLAFYADGKQNQQQAFIDISGAADGLFGYTLTSPSTSPEKLTNKFSMAGSEEDNINLYWDGDGDWLACPTDDTAGPYYIYPAKAYSKAVGKDKCTTFTIKTQKVDTPAEVCVYN